MSRLVKRIFLGLSLPLTMCSLLSAQSAFPRYCKTDAGVLGPYPNNSVKVGESCYGTKNGQRYDGVAVMSKSGNAETDGGGNENADSKPAASGFPRYCKTDAGVLGPYPNSSVKVGESCYGTKNGQRYDGVAVMSKSGNSETDGGGNENADSKSAVSGFPRYCKTDAGVLGPYPNSSVKVGEPCYGTKNGQRYDGVAVVSKSGD